MSPLPAPFAHLGEVLRELRSERGLAPEELTRRSGVPSDALSAFDEGREDPTLEALGKLLESLEVGAAELGRRLEKAAHRAAGVPEPPEDFKAVAQEMTIGLVQILWNGLRTRRGLRARKPPPHLRARAAETAEGLVELFWLGLMTDGPGNVQDGEEGEAG